MDRTGRRVVAPLLPAFAIVAFLVSREMSTQWRDDWAWGWMQWLAQVNLTGPLGGGLSAWLVISWTRAGRGEWLASLIRGEFALLSAVGWGFLAPAVVLIGSAPVVLLALREQSGQARWPIVGALAGLAALALCAVFGGVTARLLPHPVTAVVVVVALWAVVVGVAPQCVALLRAGGAGQPLAGYTINDTPTLARWLALLALSPAAISLLQPRAVKARSPQRWWLDASLLVLPIGLILGSGAFAAGTYDVRPDPAATADVCVEGRTLTVCTLPEHTARATEVERVATVVVNLRSRAGVPSDRKAREVVPLALDRASREPSPRRHSELDFVIPTPWDEQGVALSLLFPATCASAPERLDERALARFFLAQEVAQGLVTEALAGIGSDERSPAYKQFEALDQTAQKEWLKRMLLAADRCEYARMPPL